MRIVWIEFYLIVDQDITRLYDQDSGKYDVVPEKYRDYSSYEKESDASIIQNAAKVGSFKIIHCRFILRMRKKRCLIRTPCSAVHSTKVVLLRAIR